jgi:hypothetical protein
MRKVKQKHGGAIVHAEKGETANRNGRPPKLLSQMVKQLKAEGFEQVGPSTMLHTIESMIGLPVKKLKEMAEDNDAPIAQKIIATHLLSSKDRLGLLMDLLDRAHGKPKQSVDMKTDGEVKHTITFKK